MNRIALLLSLWLALMLAGCASTGSSSLERTSGLNSASPDRTAEINTRLGIGYLERGQLEIALEKLQTALVHDPSHVPAQLTLAILYEQLGDDRSAERHYRASDRLAPNDGGTQNAYAVFLCRQREFRDADRHFQRAVADPFYQTPEIALANAGSCARRAGQVEQAIEYLRQTLLIDPVNPDALYHLAEIYYEQGEAFRARAFVQRLEANGGAEAAAFLLGFRIERNLGNEREAERYAGLLESQFPRSPETAEMRLLNRHDS